LAKAFQKISNTPFMNSSSRPTQDQEELIRELQISREKTEIMENALADVAEELEFLKKQVLQPKEPQKEILSMAWKTSWKSCALPVGRWNHCTTASTAL